MTPAGLIPSLIGIRGALATTVVAVHLGPAGTLLVPGAAVFWAVVWRNGYWALDMFLVLSGFVLTRGYRDRFARWPGFRDYGWFLWARLSRFYPVHLAVLTMLIGAVVVGGTLGISVPHGGRALDAVRHLTLTQGWGGSHALTWNGPTWSLSGEWFCYLLVPLIIPLVLRLRRPVTVVAGYLCCVALPLIVYSIVGFDEAQITYVSPLWRAIGGFAAGAVLCQLTFVGSRLPGLAGRWTGLIVVACALAVIGLSFAGLSLMWVAPLSALVVLGLSEQRGLLNRLLSGRRVLRAGQLSVSLFLTHVPWLMFSGLFVTTERFPGMWGWLGVALLAVGAVVVAWATYVLIERPAQRLMKRSKDARCRSTSAG